MDDPRITLPNKETIEDILLELSDVGHDEIGYLLKDIEIHSTKKVVIYDANKIDYSNLVFNNDTGTEMITECSFTENHYVIYKKEMRLLVKYPVNISPENLLIINDVIEGLRLYLKDEMKNIEYIINRIIKGFVINFYLYEIRKMKNEK